MEMVLSVSSRTKVCGIIGHPLEHTLSPRMHNTAFRHLGLDFIYLPFPVLPPDLERAVAGMRALNFAGFNVTHPYKEKVTAFLDELDEGAGATGAVNTVVRSKTGLKGYNTDGAGLVRFLEAEAGFAARGKRVLLLGAGGAAKAVAVSLALAGAKEITVANRTLAKARELAETVNAKTPARARALSWNPSGDCPLPEENAPLREAAASADLVVQTTSLGMYPAENTCPSFPFGALSEKQVVVDIIYRPARTLFLQEAAKRGAKTYNGVGMLLHQGALAFELWTGKKAPLEVMRSVLP
jgi:shikimate dehydrogenase